MTLNDDLRAEIVSTARDLMERKLSFLEGVRRLRSLSFKVSRSGHDPDFLIFLGIESEIDHVPDEHVRSACAPEWLAKCDEEIRVYELAVRGEMDRACEVLIR